ncbi:MAG: hypothetical protein ACQESA_03310 [Patescibacteria group bacterium]
MPKRKYIFTAVIGLLFIVAATAFFWPEESPNYVVSPVYFAGKDKKYLKNEKCDCIGIEKMHPYSQDNFSSTWLCYGVYVNCHTDCLKIIHGEKPTDTDWKKIPCSEYEEAKRKEKESNKKSAMILDENVLTDVKIEMKDKKEYLKSKPGINFVEFRAKFHSDSCKHNFSYRKDGNNLKIIQNLKTETCIDFFEHTVVSGKITELSSGEYTLSFYYKYDRDIHGENTKPKKIFSETFSIK